MSYIKFSSMRRGGHPDASFRTASVYPTQSELRGTRDSSIRKNVIRGSFRSVEEYLEIQFKLLREDFVAPLRAGILKYRQRRIKENFDIYKNVTIFLEKKKPRSRFYFTKVKINEQIENLNNSKKFLNGSLLILTNDNFLTVHLAKVINREKADFAKGVIIISCVKENVTGTNFTMIECTNFFEPYFQVLQVLQHMKTTWFPMEKYIIRADTSISPTPSYLIGHKLCPESSTLNQSQIRALKAALSQEFVVIQGPPGTGKTFLGVEIVKILIQNSHLWHFNSPILVISHKNQALDQFLEGIIEFTDRLVRVGGQSKSEKLKKYNLLEEDSNLESESEDDLLYSFSNLELTCSRKRQHDQNNKMQNALVVGMTTTNAARMKDTLEELQSPIVIVEEAAEVLEAHVVAALTSSCQHLILLGDHQQLRPATADRKMGQEYHLGVSLFERMVNNGIQCYTLEVQHRMRPEISALLQATIYPFLQDHTTVKTRPNVLGVSKNVFFINHKHREEAHNTTKKNTHEAKFLVHFARYLILNGYKCEDIAILTTYSGQMMQMKREVKLLADSNLLSEIRISTLDSFQGQEAEIVLLSLVRSDGIGFLAAENRVCVALSRAKTGFYMMGNMDLLSKHSKLWTTIKSCLDKQKAIGESLSLYCQQHPRNVAKVKTKSDFDNVSCGGCTKKCLKVLECGHICKRFCHVIDTTHTRIFNKCQEICNRKICKFHPTNLCQNKCFEECQNCSVLTCSSVANVVI